MTAKLTSRQSQVRDMKASGMTVRQIANHLGLSTQRIYALLAAIKQRQRKGTA